MSYDSVARPWPRCGGAVHGRPTEVDADLARLAQSQLTHGASGGVVEVQHGQPSYEPTPRRPRHIRCSRRQDSDARNCARDLAAGGGSVASGGMANIPDRPTLDGIEARWADGMGSRSASTRSTAPRTRDQVFSIDTPPPTVSGSLHIGHVFSYTHTDTIARYQRMARQAGLLPDGLGRQRPADRAARPELLRRALRPEPAVRRGLRAAVPRRPAEGPPGDRHLPARTSSSCATSSSRSTRRSSRRCCAGSACRSTGR